MAPAPEAGPRRRSGALAGIGQPGQVARRWCLFFYQTTSGGGGEGTTKKVGGLCIITSNFPLQFPGKGLIVMQNQFPKQVNDAVVMKPLRPTYAEEVSFPNIHGVQFV